LNDYMVEKNMRAMDEFLSLFLPFSLSPLLVLCAY
jgi:hypothetical protein